MEPEKCYDCGVASLEGMLIIGNIIYYSINACIKEHGMHIQILYIDPLATKQIIWTGYNVFIS